MHMSGSSRVVLFLLLSSLFAGVAFASAILTVTAPAAQTFVEQTTNPLTTVTFTVTNNSATQAYILDFAAEIIAPVPGDPDDVVSNNGVFSASTFINPLGTGTYSYQVWNPLGNPGDCCDNGLNPISFFIEMSPMNTQPNQAVLTSTNLGFFGFFVFPTTGSSTGTENGNTLTALQNCNTAAGCTAVANNIGTGNLGLLFSNGVLGNPYPAVTSVTVNDTPELGTWWLFASGCALLAASGKVLRAR